MDLMNEGRAPSRRSGALRTACFASLALLLPACGVEPSRTGSGGDLLSMVHFGTTGNDTVQGLSVSADGAAFVAVTLDDSTVSPGSEVFSQGALLAAFDAGGGLSWAHAVRDGALPVLSGVGAANTGGPTVAGMLQAGDDTLFVDAFHEDGGPLWNHAFSSTKNATMKAITTAPDGKVLVAGSFTGGLDMGAGKVSTSISPKLFITTFDAAGNALQTKVLPDLGDTEISAAFDAAGNVILAGGLTGKVTFEDGEEASAGSSDVLVIKLDPSGNVLWHRRFGDTAFQTVNRVATGPDGMIVLAGHGGGSFEFGAASSTIDAFAAALDADGNVLFGKMFTASEGAYAMGVAVADDGAIVLTGAALSPIDFGGGPLDGDGGFIAKLAINGDHLWSRHFAGGSPKAVALDASGRVTVAGWYQERLDVGEEAFEGDAFWEIFVARFSP